MIKDLFVPLTNDLLFKEVMTHPENREALIYFLQTFTNLPQNVISKNFEVKYESPIYKTRLYDKGMIGDVIIYFSNYIVNIEMYSVFNKDSITKSICYNMRIFSTQLDIGDNYEKLDSLIQINIIDKLNTKFNDKFKSEYVLTDIFDHNEKIMADKFIVKCYRIDKTKNASYNEDNEMRWIKFIGAKSIEERRKIAQGDELLMKTSDWIDKYLMNDETLELFGSWRKRIYQEEYRKEAIREGRKVGRKIGREEGRKEGRKEGIEENKIEIAKMMKRERYSIQEICKITKLSKEVVEKL